MTVELTDEEVEELKNYFKEMAYPESASELAESLVSFWEDNFGKKRSKALESIFKKIGLL
ncbi:MAG: hypothetical protein DRP15_02120 [Candidatus Aenigmatarchaeota archaeon]|nr:MAG: hypothetical protein DRP15_02120 [Candidatus Aenigmarchaeota archaeon]